MLPPSRRLLLLELFLAAGTGVASKWYKPLNDFVTAHLWSPATSYFLLILLVAVERTATGYAANVPAKKVFRSMAMMFVGYTFALGFSHSFSESESTMMAWLRVLLLPCVVFHLRKMWRAFGIIGMLDPDAASLVDANIGEQIQRMRGQQTPPQNPAS